MPEKEHKHVLIIQFFGVNSRKIRHKKVQGESTFFPYFTLGKGGFMDYIPLGYGT